jgi:tetratricopeptide (TPR) repeat protein
MTWFTEEYQNLSAVLHEIATRQWDEPTWQLNWALGTFRWRTGRVLDEVASWRTSLAAVLRLGDPAVEALARQLLGNACARVELFDEAVALLSESVRIARDIEDSLTEAFSERGLGRALGVQQRVAEALPHHKRALALFEKVGYPVWIAGALNNVGWGAANLGEYEYAKECCERALALNRRHQPDDLSLIGTILDSLGFIAAGMGRHRDAIDYYEQARAQFATANDTYFDAETLDHLGHPYLALGEVGKAREAWQAALWLYRGHERSADAQRVQALLNELSGSAAGDS